MIFFEIFKDKWVDLEFHPLLIIYSIQCDQWLKFCLRYTCTAAIPFLAPVHYCFARYYHGTDISMITEKHSFTSSISFNSMIKVLLACQSFYRWISSSWNVTCNKFSVLELCILWIFKRVHGNTFP